MSNHARNSNYTLSLRLDSIADFRFFTIGRITGENKTSKGLVQRLGAGGFKKANVLSLRASERIYVRERQEKANRRFLHKK